MPRNSTHKDSRGWALRLEDMIAAIRNILDYTAGLAVEQFGNDQRTIDAVLHNFAVLGEAARHVPPDVESATPDVPWSEMRVMRNIAVHVYHGIKLDRVWKTITDDLPPLLPLREAMLAELDASQTDQTP